MPDELVIDEMERPNLNAVHLAGEVGTVETVGKQQQGLKFTVRFTKAWPDGIGCPRHIVEFWRRHRFTEGGEWIEDIAATLSPAGTTA
jgi:hypothetical protein